jgi:hypothetical protein
MLIDLNRNKAISDVLLGEEVNCLFKSDLKDDALTIDLITNNSSKTLYSGNFDRELRFSFCSDGLTTSLLKFEFMNSNKIEYCKLNTTSPVALKTKIIDLSSGSLFLEIIIENICVVPLQIHFIINLQNGTILSSKFCPSSFINPGKRIHEVIPIPIFNDFSEGKVSIDYKTLFKSRGKLQTVLKNLLNYESNVLFFPKDVKKCIFCCSNFSSSSIGNVEVYTSVPNYLYIEKIKSMESIEIHLGPIPGKDIEICISYRMGNRLLFFNYFFQL